MSKWDDTRPGAPGAKAGGKPDTPDLSRAAENEEWAWMVDEDPAFYLEEAAQPERRGG